MSRPLVAVARTGPTDLRAFSLWIARLLKSLVVMKWTAASKTSTMISGGTCRAITWLVLNGACRHSSKTGSFQRIFCPINTVIQSTSGIYVRARISKALIWAKTTRWPWKSGLPTTPPRNMASAVWWSIRPTCKAQSLRGGAMRTAHLRPRRRSRLIRSLRMRMICQSFSKALAPVRHWSLTSTSASMTASYTSRAGAWARCISTMCLIQ